MVTSRQYISINLKFTPVSLILENKSLGDSAKVHRPRIIVHRAMGKILPLG